MYSKLTHALEPPILQASKRILHMTQMVVIARTMTAHTMHVQCSTHVRAQHIMCRTCTITHTCTIAQIHIDTHRDIYKTKKSTAMIFQVNAIDC